ncbi:MAG: YncE family protein [Caldilineaceae bacterium]
MTPTPTETPTPTPTDFPTATVTPTPVVGDVACPADGCNVTGLAHPKQLAYHSGQNAVYITSNGSDELFKLDADSNEVLVRVPTGDGPWPLVIDEARNRIYVANYTSGDVWIYDATTLQVIHTITIGSGATGMAFLPALDAVAVAIHSSGNVAIIQNMTLVDTLSSTGGGPFGITAVTDHNLFVVVNRDSGNARVLYHDATRWRNDGPSITPGPGMDRVVPFTAVYQSTGRRLYIQYVVADGRWFVDAYRMSDVDRFYITREAQIQVGNSGASSDAQVGGMGIAANAVTSRVFVANNFDGTVSIINSETNRVFATLPMGTDPFGLAVDTVHSQCLFAALRNVNRFAKLTLLAAAAAEDGGKGG